jgi:hypothetical protein
MCVPGEFLSEVRTKLANSRIDVLLASRESAAGPKYSDPSRCVGIMAIVCGGVNESGVKNA